jgi:iron complex outermembrane receptor protein
MTKSCSVLWVVLSLAFNSALAQSEKDSVKVLQEITVEAFASDRNPKEIPAAIGLLSQPDLNRFSNSSLLPAMNMLPGVRMEERSPGSYRFSIRGSLLRSPFGVRNVKFYWNGLPFTDGGGNTYLNLLDFSTIGSAEVIKGPASSLYGAGTGGAVLMRSPSIVGNTIGINGQYGSYGLLRYGGAVQIEGPNETAGIQFTHQQSDGYRTQSGLKRNSLQTDMNYFFDQKNSMKIILLVTDLYYQTPGGLNLAQYQSDPSQARPSSGTVPGAVDQHAAVYNKTYYSGLMFEHQWNDAWTTSIGLVGSNTDFKNPTIRNFESRSEQNLGSRFSNEYKFIRSTWTGKMTFGAEYQHFFSPVKVTNNLGGTPGAMVFSNDEITSDLAMGFGQFEVELPRLVFITLGASINYLQLKDNRLSVNPIETFHRKFNPVVSPRIALLKRFSTGFGLYASASKGFSPPTVAEVIPSTGIYNPNLNPETGWSYEVGLSGTLDNTIDYHLALYDFRLDNTIVIQRDSTGADYFVNAGNTVQQGIELNASWTRSSASALLKSFRLYTSITYNHYRFGQYVNDGNDYSGKQVTGVAPLIMGLGLDLAFQKGFYARMTANFVDRIPLNDANTDYASDYLLLGFRAGYRISLGLPIEFFVGADNLLNQKYSLGNDLNAAGGRYYNAAAPANYYVGITSSLPFGKKGP